MIEVLQRRPLNLNSNPDVIANLLMSSEVYFISIISKQANY
jgi:hypothetical protein